MIGSARVLGKKWSIPLLYELREGRFRGFYDFEKTTTITPRSLSRELKSLERVGVISKGALGKYSVTEKGEEFCALIDDLKQWNIRWNNVHANCANRSCLDCQYFPGKRLERRF